jgi:hypothetical protein
MHRSIHLSLRDIPENHKRAEERVDMGYENWDAALVIRANELLTEVRRYHADAEATRLQLSSSAASIARKVDELPVLVRQVVETCFEQDASSAERATVAKRLDLSTRMLGELSTKLHGSGMAFLRQARRASTVIFVCAAISSAAVWWSLDKVARTMHLSTEISDMRKTIDHLRQAEMHGAVRTCIDSSSRSRLCVRIDEKAGKQKDSYYFIDR